MIDFEKGGLNRFRITRGVMASRPEDGNYGAFVIPMGGSSKAFVVAADGDETGWEHVSVHVKYKTSSGKIKQRTPTWKEMCRIKSLFFEDDETVVQFHPKHSEYINNHANCLHLWRREGEEHALPPSELVGLKALNPG